MVLPFFTILPTSAGSSLWKVGDATFWQHVITVTHSSKGPHRFVLPVSDSFDTGYASRNITDNYQYRTTSRLTCWILIWLVERQLPFDMALSVAYAGSRGLDLWQPANEANPFCPTSNTFVPQGCAGFTTVVPNALPVWSCPGTCPAGFNRAPRLNPFFANFALLQHSGGESWYNALEVNLTKRVGHGLEFQSAYTYSKLLDDTEGLSNSDTSGSQTGLIEDPFNTQARMGPGQLRREAKLAL